MKFSIILPVYNVEKYIKKCLESIVAQTYTDYEVVVVDDQTPDNSMQIVEAFAEAYPERFNIIHQQNKGLGGARNTGVLASKGEYLLFVDSDDYIQKNTLEVLSKYVENNQYDLLEFNYFEVSPSGKVLRLQTMYDKACAVTSKEDKAQILLGSPIACNKVFRREFFINSGVLFPEKTLYEDAITRILIAKAKSIMCCTEYLYNYVQHEGSIMNSNVSERTLDITKVVDQVYDVFLRDDMLNDYGDALKATLISSLLCIIDGVYMRNPNHPILKRIVEYTVNKFTDYSQNPYLTQDIKNKLNCLLRNDFAGYEKCKKIMKIKSFILSFPLLRKLNNLRK